jgi:hypothetical protein
MAARVAPYALMAAQLQGAQADDRRAQAAPSTPTSDDLVLLEQPQRPKTESGREEARQQEMMRTARSFSPGGETEGEQQPTAPEQGPERQPQERQQGPSPEAERAAQLTQAQDASRRGQDEEQAAKAEAAGGISGALKRANTFGRNSAKMIQAAFAETGFPFVTLFIQLNVETANKWIFQKNLPPFLVAKENPRLDPNDITTGCLDGCCCLIIIMFFLFVVFWFMALPAYVANNPWQAFTDALGALFKGMY